MDSQNLNAAPASPMTADELRSLLVKNFEEAKPIFDAYHEYARRAAALAEEYHAARFKESCLKAEFCEQTLITTCDARETPTSLDRKLLELQDAGITIKRIIFDRVKTTYYLFK